jgi:predicted AAA+ superfamily ATPase
MGIKNLIKSGDIEVWDDIYDARLDDKAAPDLSDILRGKEEPSYSHPEEFFKRTYMTMSMKELIEEIAEVLKTRKGGRIFLLTSLFGGGKTHTLISLYHVYKSPEKLRTISSELSAKVAELGRSTIIVMDGSRASLVPHPDEPYKTEGFIIKTIWGMLAYRLGAYAKIKHLDSEKAAVPDVDLLKSIFSEVREPVLILMDEIVHYVFNMIKSRLIDYGKKVLLFLDYLARAVESSPNIVLVVSVQAEYRIVEGQKLLREEEIFEGYARQILNILTRESTRLIIPVAPEDVIKVLQKRIFKKVSESEAQKAMNRLHRVYRENPELFGIESDWQFSPSEGERIVSAKEMYPFHQKYVEVLQEFVTRNRDLQKTRDAIRITRKVVRKFLRGKEDAEFIMPWHIDLRDSEIRSRVLTDSRREFRDVANRDICTEEGELGTINECSKPMLAFRIATAVLLKTYTYETFKEPLKVFPDLKNVALMVYELETFTLERYQPADIKTILEEMEGKLPHFASEKERYWFTPYPSVLEYVEKKADEKLRERGLELYKALRESAEGILLRKEGKKGGIIEQGEIFNEKNTTLIGYGEQLWEEIEIKDEPHSKLVVLVKPEVTKEEVEKIILMKGDMGRRIFRNTIAVVCPPSPSEVDFEPLLSFAAKIKAAEEVQNALSEYYIDKEIRSLQEGKLKKYIQVNENLLNQQLLATLTRIAYPARGEVGDEVRWISTTPASTIISQVEAGLKDPSTGPKLRTDFSFNDLVDFLKRNQNWDLIEGIKQVEFREIVNVFYTTTAAPFTTRETIERVILDGLKSLDIGIEMDGVLYWKCIGPENKVDLPPKLKDTAVILPYALAAQSLKDKLLAESGMQKIGEKIHIVWYEVEIAGKKIKLENLVTQKGWEKILKMGIILKQMQIIERGFILKIIPSSLTIKPSEKAEVKVNVASIQEYDLEVKLIADKGKLNPDRGKLPLNATWDLGILNKPGEYRFTITAEGLDGTTANTTLIVTVESREAEITVDKLDLSHVGAKLVSIIPKNLISFKMALDIVSKLNLKAEGDVEINIGENISFSGDKMDVNIAGLFIQKFTEIFRTLTQLQEQTYISGTINLRESVAIDNLKIAAFTPLAEKVSFKLRVEKRD